MKTVISKTRNRLFLKSFLIFFIGILSLVGTVFAADTGAISGRVTDNQGNGILNVRVVFYSYSSESCYSFVYSSYTDSNGNYTAPSLPTGNYKVWFDTSSVTGNFASEWYNNKISIAAADLVPVIAGQTTANINAQLEPGGIISGRVTNFQGNGILGVWVDLYDLNNSYIRYGTTDSSGNYTIQGLPSGSYKVRFSPSNNTINYISEWYNNKTSSAAADLVPVIAGQTTANINAQLEPGGIISGRVTNSQGNGILGVWVDLYDLNNSYSRYGTTDSSGNYTIQGLPSGSYKVRFSPSNNTINYISEWYNNKTSSAAADLVPVIAGQTTANINAQLEPGGIISGRVTNSQGNGIQSVSVYVYDLNNSNSYIKYGTTDSSGNYTVQGFPSGNYKVQFSPSNTINYIPEWYNNKTSSAAADLVPVIAGQTTANINAQLEPGGIISGRVTNSLGNGIQSVSVYVYDLNNSNSYIKYGTTDSSGNYTVQGLPSSSYKVRFSHSCNYFTEWYSDKTSFAAADLVPVIAGQTTANINAQLEPGGTISGRVTNSQGNGIQSVWVWVYDLNNSFINGSSTDSSGNYTVQKLPTGSYKVQFSPSDTINYIPEWYNNKTSSAAADLVPVIAGQTTANINAQLEPGGIISGRVTNSQGNGIQGVWADAYELTNSNSYFRYGTTDSSGNYTVQGLPPGSYKVRFSHNIYFSEWYNDKTSFAAADSVPVTVGQSTSGIDAQLQAEPSAVTGPATKVTHNSATLNGTVNPNGLLTNYYFQWGTTTAYEYGTPSQSAGSGSSNVVVSAKLTGLTPKTTYHYRLIAIYTVGTTTWGSAGADMSFETSVNKGLPWLMLLLEN